MKKFVKKSIVVATALATVLGSTISVSAANSDANIKDNEKALLEWIATRPHNKNGEKSTIYTLAKEQFAYTTGDISAADMKTIQDSLTKADDLLTPALDDTAANRAKLLTYAQDAAKALGGAAIAIDDATDAETSIGFVRFNENNKNDIEVIYLGVEKTPTKYEETQFISVNGQKYPIVNGATVSTDKYQEIDGEHYYLEANGDYTYVPDVTTSYYTHVQSIGDQDIKKNGAVSGTFGQAKRLEAIYVKVESNGSKAAEGADEFDLGISYVTHCQTYGWLPWSSDFEMNGTAGEAKRLEAIKIQLTGAVAEHYDVCYRVHAQSYGWLDWASNGEAAGTAGYGKRLEGIQIVVAPKWKTVDIKALEKVDGVKATVGKAYVAKEGTSAEVPATPVPTVMYKTHVQTYGWQNWKTNGAMSGTSGEAKRLEGINIKLTNTSGMTGNITYRTHVQTYGWQGWKSNGTMSGTSGEAKRLEAIEIKLDGQMAENYDVYYRVHAQSFGWLGWAKNGESAGTAKLAKRLEGIQIVLVKKGDAAPANNYGGITSVKTEAFVQGK